PSTGSALGVPILSGTLVLGVLTLTHRQPGHFSDDHLRLMQAAADQMALAVRNAQIFDEQRRLTERQVTLYEVLRVTSEQLDRDGVAQVARTAISRYAGWPDTAIALLNEERQEWVLDAPAAGPAEGQRLVFPVDRGVIGRAIRTAQTQYVPDVSQDPDYVARLPTTRSELAIPLVHGGEVVGVLNVESDQADGFDGEERLLAESLADAVSLALNNAQLHKSIADERSRLEATISASRDGIILVDLERRLTVINVAALTYLSLPGEPETWTNRPIDEALQVMEAQAPRVVALVRTELQRTQRGDEPPGEGEYEIPPRAIRWINLPVMAEGLPMGRLVVLRDVTGERAVARLRDDLIHTTVHDLRNPLTSIFGALELLTRGKGQSLTEVQQKALAIARSGIDQMLNLVNAILDINRLESGQMPLEREPVALAELVSRLLELQAPVAAERQVHLENRVPAGLPPAWVDARLLQRVLQNLVGNALKFTPADGVIGVTAALLDGEAPALSITVSDTGPGIPPDVHSRLFQKFVTGDLINRGSGLGLAFCRLAVEAHGGRIWAESAAGRGTRFTFTIPVQS
ncbi:MAG: GAF domain-containing protein, partial [Chloroflexi bacterium]|nr:GAF domain-containing protein [Chloroflexota bacterium]